MLRSIGAILFGIAADRYGRKWPFVVNNALFIVLELVSSFVLSLVFPPFTFLHWCGSALVMKMAEMVRGGDDHAGGDYWESMDWWWC